MKTGMARAPKGAGKATGRMTAKARAEEEAASSKNAPGRPTLAELERRKGEIMKVATALFVREGYSATSLVDIAKSAGVATRTLYQHYGDKEALFNMVMFARETAAVLPPPELGDDDTLFDALMRIADYACDVTFRATTVDMMRLAISESQRFPQMMRKLMDRSQAHFNANVRKVFDDLVERRMVEDEDTAVSAEIFINLILGNTPLLIFGGWKANLPTREQLAQRIDLFILGRWGPVVARKAHAAPGKRPRPRSGGVEATGNGPAEAVSSTAKAADVQPAAAKVPARARSGAARAPARA